MQATGPKSKSRSRVDRIPWRLHSDEDAITRLLADRSLKHPQTAIYPLAAIVDAHQQVEAGANTKVPVRLPD